MLPTNTSSLRAKPEATLGQNSTNHTPELFISSAQEVRKQLKEIIIRIRDIIEVITKKMQDFSLRRHY